MTNENIFRGHSECRIHFFVFKNKKGIPDYRECLLKMRKK